MGTTTAVNKEEHVAWLRYDRSGKVTRIACCDSDAPGAFRVYRHPKTAGTSFTDEQVRHLVNRFLCYPFPPDLNPDGGISYGRSETSIKFNHPGPVGTNLLTAEQADAMVRYMVEGLPI